MAENVAQRIENRLRTDLEKPSLSVSIGVGVYPDDGRTPGELIEAADRRLYQRKRARTSGSSQQSKHTHRVNTASH
jgi:GGDEF domain-containing protein